MTSYLSVKTIPAKEQLGPNNPKSPFPPASSGSDGARGPLFIDRLPPHTITSIAAAFEFQARRQ